MLLVAIVLTFLAGLTVARRLADPPCPSCSAKSWTENHPRLECRKCGWTNFAPVAATAVESNTPQVGLATGD